MAGIQYKMWKITGGQKWAGTESATNYITIMDDGTIHQYIGNIEVPISSNNIISHIRGFDRLNSDTMGTVTYGNATTRTFSITPKSGVTSFNFKSDGTLFQLTTTHTLACPDVTGTYYWYFDTSGVLQVALNGAISGNTFITVAICGMAYYNKEQGTFEGAKDEQHGAEDSGGFIPITHLNDHLTRGLQYGGHGGEITGASVGSGTYTNITAAVHFDEDIIIQTALETAHSFMYALTVGGVTGWVFTAADNELGFINSGDTQICYNENDGGNMVLTESTRTDDYITYMVAQTNLATHHRVKAIGQQSYASARDAREGMESNLKAMKLIGLPSAEFEWQFAYIVDKNGNLVALENGDLFKDLRNTSIASL